MAGAYVYTPDIWPPLAAAIFLAALGLYSWRRRSVSAARLLAVSSLFGTLWLLGLVFEAAAVAPATKIAWFKFQATLKAPALTAITCFILEYVYPGRWLTRRNLALLACPTLVTLVFILARNSQLMWQRLELAQDGSVTTHFATPGAVMAVCVLGLALVDAAAFLWLFVRSPQHRWPVALMLFGDITGRGLYLLGLAHVPWAAPFKSDIPGILLVWTMNAIALFGFRIFDPRPAARAAAMEQIREGIVVLNSDRQVVSLNPAAAQILSLPAARAGGKTLAELLPTHPDLSARLADAAAGAGPIEVSLGTGPAIRLYALSLSVLRDFRGLLLGYLLQLSDITEQRRAQAQLLGQRWAEATLQEREQLAHELHDSLSQSLGFLNMQAQAAQLYLQRGQEEDARASLVRLAEVSRETQNDVRELIGNLLVASLPSAGFCAALRQVVARFETQTGLAVRLDIADSATAICGPSALPASNGVQLVRVVQEALANVRKHAGRPGQISVRLGAEAAQMHLTIEDNGAGFDPSLPGDEGEHFGLQVMRQRVVRIGGQITVHSAPDLGTRVEVCMPLNPLQQEHDFAPFG